MATKGNLGSNSGDKGKATSGGKLGAIVARAKQKTAEKQKTDRLAELRRKQQQRQTARAAQTLPKPRRVAPRAQATATAGRQATQTPKPKVQQLDEQLRSKLSLLEMQYGSLQRKCELGDVYDGIGQIEDLLTNLPLKLDQLRGRGYVHSAHLENELDVLDDQWDDIRPRVEQNLKQQISRLDSEMDAVEANYNRLISAPNKVMLEKVDAGVDSLEKRVNSITSNIRQLYQGVRDRIAEVEDAIQAAEWMVEQIDASTEIHLYEAEGPLLAVEAEWEQDGEDEGPDGILYLTDQRLLFEQKEEVVKKKFLFITTDKEKVQKLLLNIPAREIQDVSHDEEGRGFLSMRKDDILQIVFSANAPISRGRFHLKGQDSSDWAVMIKHVCSGEIDELRADGFVEEMQAAAAATASLPAQCPSCFADVPPQPRGVTKYTCDFCNALIEAVA